MIMIRTERLHLLPVHINFNVLIIYKIKLIIYKNIQ